MSETSIGVSEETKKKLDKAKKYERETYEDVILRLIDLQEVIAESPRTSVVG